MLMLQPDYRNDWARFDMDHKIWTIKHGPYDSHMIRKKIYRRLPWPILHGYAEAARNSVQDDAVAFLQIRSTTLFISVLALYFISVHNFPSRSLLVPRPSQDVGYQEGCDTWVIPLTQGLFSWLVSSTYAWTGTPTSSVIKASLHLCIGRSRIYSVKNKVRVDTLFVCITYSKQPIQRVLQLVSDLALVLPSGCEPTSKKRILTRDFIRNERNHFK